MTDPTDFIATYKRFLEGAIEEFDTGERRLPPLTGELNEHLSQDVRELPVVKESLSRPRLVDADIALEAIGTAGGSHRVVGVSGDHGLGEAPFASILRG